MFQTERRSLTREDEFLHRRQKWIRKPIRGPEPILCLLLSGVHLNARRWGGFDSQCVTVCIKYYIIHLIEV